MDVARGDTVVVDPRVRRRRPTSPSASRACSSTRPRTCRCSCATTTAPVPRSSATSTRWPPPGPSSTTCCTPAAPHNLGFVGNVNAAFEQAAPADVVVVNSDVIVGPGWLEGLRAAAYADETVATASTLTNHGTIVSVPRRNAPSPAPPPGMAVGRGRPPRARRRPADPPAPADRDRPLHVRAPLRARAGGPVRPRLLARLRRGGRLLAALRPVTASSTCWPTTCSSTTAAPARSPRRRRAPRAGGARADDRRALPVLPPVGARR